MCQARTGVNAHTFVHVFTVVSAYREVMQTPLTCCRRLILSAMGCFAPGGMRQTQKGIITFLPKHRNSMNYLRYTRRAPRQLQDRTTQDSVREPWGQGPAEEPGGIIGDPEVTSEGKLNDKKQKEGVGSGEWERSFIHRFVECVYAHASIYHGCHTHTPTLGHRYTHIGIHICKNLITDSRTFTVNIQS